MEYVVATESGKFYTGKAGDGWLSANRNDAFTYATYEGARAKVETFNKRSRLTGETFGARFRELVECYVEDATGERFLYQTCANTADNRQQFRNHADWWLRTGHKHNPVAKRPALPCKIILQTY